MIRAAKPDAKGRRKAGYEKHARIHRWVAETPAYRHLGHSARALLVELQLLYSGENNGSLFLSVRTAAERLNCAPGTAQKAFADLVAHGFIKPHVKGSFHVKERHATEWILTEHGFAGQLPTKDFMRWRPEAKTKTRYQNLTQAVSNGDTDARR